MSFFIDFLMKSNHLTTELHRSQINASLTKSVIKVDHLATQLERLQINTFLNRIFKERELSWQQGFRGYKSMHFLIDSLMKVSLWETRAPEAQIHYFLNRILNESDPEL